MTELKRTLEILVERADTVFDRTRARFRSLEGPHSPRLIMAYKGFGTVHALNLAGRVVRDPGFATARGAGDSQWRNLIEFYQRLESDEVPRARVRYRFQDSEGEVVADDEGYFHCHIAPLRPIETGQWHQVDLELVEPPGGMPPFRTRGAVLVPAGDASFGVISDIDDTVLQSQVRQKLRMLLLVALSNARTRKPFPGVASFYRALQRGPGGRGNNPVFYVSGSPWNLYEPLVQFLDVQEIPEGPVLLKDFGSHTLFAADQHSYKLGCIERILATYPQLPFVLIGDSGEQDPEIYAEVVRRFPQRIRVIYIRNVLPDASRIAAISRLIVEVRDLDTQLVLAPDSEFAAAHAAGEGLISAAAWEAVRDCKEKDASAPTPASLARVRPQS